MKRKIVHFDQDRKDEKNYTISNSKDNGLRSPGHKSPQHNYSTIFTNSISPSKGILKNKLIEQKAITYTVSFQEQQQKLLFKILYNGLKYILIAINKHISDKEIRRTAIGFFFAAMADFQLELLTKVKKTYQTSGILSAKKAHILDLYSGAIKLSKHQLIKSKADKAFADFSKIHKTRFFYSGNREYNRFKDRKRITVAKSILKEYLRSTIGVSQGSDFNNCIEEFVRLVYYLFDKFGEEKIVTHQVLITQIQSILNDTQIELYTIKKELEKIEVTRAPITLRISCYV